MTGGELPNTCVRGLICQPNIGIDDLIFDTQFIDPFVQIDLTQQEQGPRHLDQYMFPREGVITTGGANQSPKHELEDCDVCPGPADTICLLYLVLLQLLFHGNFVISNLCRISTCLVSAAIHLQWQFATEIYVDITN